MQMDSMMTCVKWLMPIVCANCAWGGGRWRWGVADGRESRPTAFWQPDGRSCFSVCCFWRDRLKKHCEGSVKSSALWSACVLGVCCKWTGGRGPLIFSSGLRCFSKRPLHCSLIPPQPSAGLLGLGRGVGLLQKPLMEYREEQRGAAASACTTIYSWMDIRVALWWAWLMFQY